MEYREAAGRGDGLCDREGEKAGHNGQREGSAGKVSRENIRGRVKVMESNRMRGELVR